MIPFESAWALSAYLQTLGAMYGILIMVTVYVFQQTQIRGRNFLRKVIAISILTLADFLLQAYMLWYGQYYALSQPAIFGSFVIFAANITVLIIYAIDLIRLERRYKIL